MEPISIIIPAFNEERRLPATLDTVLDFANRQHINVIEILVVDDGSEDDTAECIRKYASTHPLVRLLSNPGNKGKGYAVRHGMMKSIGAWTLFSDADLSAPINELPKLLDAAHKSNAAIAIGSRALDRSLIGVHQSATREYAGRIFNVIVRDVTGLPFLDTQCGFKLYRRDAVEAIFPRQQLEGFGFDVENLFIARRLGFKAVEVPVRWNNAEGTKVTLFGGLDSFLDPFRVRWFDLQGRYREQQATPRHGAI